MSRRMLSARLRQGFGVKDPNRRAGPASPETPWTGG